MSDHTAEPFLFPAINRKKVTAAFDGGRLTSDGGVVLLAAAERRLGVAERLAGLIADPRNPLFVTHSYQATSGTQPRATLKTQPPRSR